MEPAEELGTDDLEHPELLPAGSRVGDYVVERVLGSGGFGTVYEATNPIIARRVAIKVLARRYSADPNAVARFLAEARVVNQVRHKNIVDISAFGRLEDGRHYHVMEYLEGETLQQLLARRGRLTLDKAVPLFKGMAAALDAAHGRGIAHRDLKPANVFVASEDGVITPKIIDFGIAKLLSDEGAALKTKSGALMGTPRYMSPEQARGKPVDHRTDVYSFGLVAYEVLTGTGAFEGDDDLEILLKHTSERPELPSARCADLPAPVDALVIAMLAKDPLKRPSSLLPVARWFERIAAGDPIDLAALEAEIVPSAAGGEERPPRTTSDETLPPERAPVKDSPSADDAAPARRGARPVAVGAAVAVVVAVAAVAAFRPAPPASPIAPETGGSASVAAPVSPTTEALRLAPSSAELTPPNARVRVQIAGAPAGTEVLGKGGVVLGTAPGSIEIDRHANPLELTFRRAGYADEARVIVPSRDQTVHVMMKRRSLAARRTPGPDDTENPFR